MAATGGEPKQIRTFVALDIPERIRQALAKWGQRELDRSRPAARPRPRTCISRSASSAGPTSRGRLASRKSSSGSILGRWRCALPRAGREAAAAAAALRARRRFPGGRRAPGGARGEPGRRGLHEPEKRPFWPHLTVARVQDEARQPAPAGSRAAPGEPARPPRTYVRFRPNRSLPFESAARGGAVRVPGQYGLAARGEPGRGRGDERWQTQAKTPRQTEGGREGGEGQGGRAGGRRDPDRARVRRRLADAARRRRRRSRSRRSRPARSRSTSRSASAASRAGGSSRSSARSPRARRRSSTTSSPRPRRAAASAPSSTPSTRSTRSTPAGSASTPTSC